MFKNLIMERFTEILEEQTARSPGHFLRLKQEVRINLSSKIDVQNIFLSSSLQLFSEVSRQQYNINFPFSLTRSLLISPYCKRPLQKSYSAFP